MAGIRSGLFRGEQFDQGLVASLGRGWEWNRLGALKQGRMSAKFGGIHLH
jgi:hypothetical protein